MYLLILYIRNSAFLNKKKYYFNKKYPSASAYDVRHQNYLFIIKIYKYILLRYRSIHNSLINKKNLHYSIKAASIQRRINAQRG